MPTAPGCCRAWSPPSDRGRRNKAALSSVLSDAHQEGHALNQGVGMLQVGELWVTGPSWSLIAVVRDTVSDCLALKIETRAFLL